MRQLTLRIPEGLADQVQAVARERGQSVNGYTETVLRAAVDPDFAGDDAERLRERMVRAGLLAQAVAAPTSPPAAVDLERARAAAGRGRPLADLVSESRR